MIISRAPFRISLAGGGSDLPSYSDKFGGEVFSFTINKYIYIAIHSHYPGGIKLNYSSNETVQSVKEIKHPLFRETLNHLNFDLPVEIASFADIPSSGSGLGSSSAFTVALINAIGSFSGRTSSPHELAEIACHVEIELCQEPIGKQDQFASAFGGIRHFEFSKDGLTNADKFVGDNGMKEFLDSCLSAFYLGFGRSASDILAQQSKLMDSHDQSISSVKEMVELVSPTIEAVRGNNYLELGELLTLGWNLKKSLTSKISNQKIEHNINLAIKAGALGAKILGAGGGGFMLVCHPPGMRKSLSEKLSHLRMLDFQVSMNGANIVYSDEGNK